MNREKITERYVFSEEERWDILKKTGQRCAHCGKPIFAIPNIENTMTVDHFIPIYKGGTNRMINLIGLCPDCNKNKGSRVVNPEGYLKYMKPKYLDEIKGYYDSYIHSFRYLSEKNLFADDEFTINVPYYPAKGMRNNKKAMIHIDYTVKKAMYSDLDRVYEYYLGYLKKYGCLDGEGYAKKNILNWFENGCIYFAEKNGKMIALCAFDVINVYSTKSKYDGKAIEIWAFSYYNRQQAGELISEMILSLPQKIMTECDIPALPIVISIIKSDKIYQHLTLFKDYFLLNDEDERISRSFNIIRYNSKNGAMALCSSDVLTTEEKTKMTEFMKNFSCITENSEVKEGA